MTLAASTFHHDALLYDGIDEFVSRSVDFVREGLAQGEPVMVAVPGRRLEPLRTALGDDADDVAFVDMVRLGRNPGRIIPAWSTFVATAGPGPARGIGEPIWAGRSAEELVECQIHEALINVAFPDAHGFQLVCPYDTAALPEAVVDEARRTHPALHGEGGCRHDVGDADELLGPLARPLAPPPAHADVMTFGVRDLSAVRALAKRHADRAGLSPDRTGDLLLAVGELSCNSVEHGDGGTAYLWTDEDVVCCEVADDGHITDPLAGRHVPGPEADRGRGLWVTHQLCDLVQLRTGTDGTQVRVRVGPA